MKTFTLFKRDAAGRPIPADSPAHRDEPLYFKFDFRKKRHTRCLGTNDARLAQQLARRMRQEIIEGIIREDAAALAATKLRQSQPPKVSTLGQIFIAYRKRAGISSAAANISSLRSIVRYGLDQPDLTAEEIDRLPATILTQKLFRDYQTKIAPYKTPRTAEERTAIITCNSTITQARSIFRRELVEEGVFAEEGVHLPDLAGIRRVKKHRQPATPFQPLPEDLLQRIYAGLPALKEANPNAYRAFLLSACLGLRREECVRAKFSHIHTIRRPVPLGQPEQTRRVLHVGISKNGAARIVPVEEKLFQELTGIARILPLHHPSDPAGLPPVIEDYILEGTETQRYETAFDDLTAWLKRQGWTRRKKAHELRKHYGSQVAEQFGTRAGAAILGNSEKVFSSNYDAILNLPEVTTFPTAAQG